MADRRWPLWFGAFLLGCNGTVLVSPAPHVARVAPPVAWIAESDQADAAFGRTAGADVDGDGAGDLLVGAPGFDDGATDEGEASVYPGGPAGPGAAPSWTATAGQSAAALGSSIANAGDVDGDGCDDLLVGAPGFDVGAADEGMVGLYLGSSVGPSSTVDWTARGLQAGAALGTAVSGAGDVDGDGYADLAAGAPGFDGGQADEGQVGVWLGSASGPSALVDWSVQSNQAGAQLATVASAGDVDGDGFDDLLVGAPLYDASRVDEGKAWLYLGDSAGLASVAAWSTTSGQDAAWLGASLAGAGDVDGDGFDDILVGAPGWSNVGGGEGRAALYPGTSAGPGPMSWTQVAEVAGAHFGRAVDGAGDLNADGYGDIAVGADGWSYPEAGEGQVSVYYGSAAGLELEVGWTYDPDVVAGLGASVSAAGDANADGFADLLVGAPSYSDGEIGEGAAMLFAGGCYDPVDADGDGVGDACDVCPAGDDTHDSDGDGILDGCDFVLYVGSLAAGWNFGADVFGAQPGERVDLFASRGSPASGPCPPNLGGHCVQLPRPKPLAWGIADATGHVQLIAPVPGPAVPGDVVSLQAVVIRGVGGVDSDTTNAVETVVTP